MTSGFIDPLMLRRLAIFAAVLALSLCPSAARAQCPNGSPPPCEARRAPEATRDVPRSLDPSRMVVLRFTNGSIGKYSTELEPLRHAITDNIVAELTANSTVRVVDAAPVPRRAGTDVGTEAGTASAVQAGRELGAARAVFGGYVGDASGNLRIIARVVDVKTATILFSVTVNGKQDAILESLALVGARMRCRLQTPGSNASCAARPVETPEASGSGTEKLPSGAPVLGALEKVPFRAVMSYSKALDALDSRDTVAAIRLARESVAAFPAYRAAQDLLKRLTPAPKPHY